MLKKLFIGAVLAGLCGLIGFAALAWKPAIPPAQGQTPASFAPMLVEKGAGLAGGGYCAACHTRQGGKPYAGGFAMATPFGTIYSTNITPDPANGIGNWPLTAFTRAMREGVSRDGRHLYPVFSFDHFTKLSDADVEALYAYFMTREPVHAPPPENQLPFPFNVRYLQAGWKLLFFWPGRFVPTAGKSVEWNRGAYLSEGLSHCGACHTPRNLLGAEKSGDAYGGASIDEWVAPALTAANPAPAPWTVDELFTYLSTGASPLHGSAAGPMAPVIRGLRGLPDSDIRAIATYFAEKADAEKRSAAATPEVLAFQVDAATKRDRASDADARLYTNACASCHYNATTPPAVTRPELALNSALQLSNPANLIQVVMRGIPGADGVPGVVMPGFSSAMSDSEVARLAAYLRRTRTNLPPWPDLEKHVAAVRAQIGYRPLSVARGASQ